MLRKTHDAKQSPVAPAAQQPPAVGAGPASTGSRRRRLWDLGHECHCPVIGVCLPLDILRRLVNKAFAGVALADDYDVHVGAALAHPRCDAALPEVLCRDMCQRQHTNHQPGQERDKATSFLSISEIWS